MHAGQEEQEHGEGGEGEPGVEVERGQEGHRGSCRVLRDNGVLTFFSEKCNKTCNQLKTITQT